MNVDAEQPPAQAVEQDRRTGKPKLQVDVREATEADLADTVSRISSFGSVTVLLQQLGF